MSDRFTDGLTLSDRHLGVLRAALQRVGIPRWSTDYEDYLQEARLIYARYYQHYDTPLTEPAELAKFNRLAGWFVYLYLVKQRTAERTHRSQRAAVAATELTTLQAQEAAAISARDAPLVDRLATQAALATLMRTATPTERTLLQLRARGQTDREIATVLALTPRTVGRMRQHLAARFRALLA